MAICGIFINSAWKQLFRKHVFRKVFNYKNNKSVLMANH